MATKMTVDGNTAVGHVAYAFSDLPHHPFLSHGGGRG